MAWLENALTDTASSRAGAVAPASAPVATRADDPGPQPA